MDHTPWQDEALCRQVGPGVFCTDDREARAEAKRICRDCPVRAQCLRAAMREEGTTPGTHRATVRGGLTPYQRSALATTLRTRRAA